MATSSAAATPSKSPHHEHADSAIDIEPPKTELKLSILDNGSIDTCRSPPPAQKRAKRRKQNSFFAALCSTLVDHQLGLSLNLILLLGLTHVIFPRARIQTRKFIELSYYNPTTGEYSRGFDDLYLVCFWVIAFTGLRVAVMDYILIPAARYGGVKTPKATIRFAEQAWLVIYCSIFWSFGMYLYRTSSYWLNLREMWTEFPKPEMQGPFKWYYLVQFAFWIQQIVVVNIEERRKDYEQMFSHHIITCSLMFFSYGVYQTNVGNVILCCMDIGDILLSGAKVLRYLNYQKACDVTFAVFLAAWIVGRHVFYLMICWSVHRDVPVEIGSVCYSTLTGQRVGDDGGSEIIKNFLQPFRDPQGVVCFNERIRWLFLGLLLALQGILLLWLFMIVRVAIKVITGNGADDSRSDDEDEDEESEEVESPVADEKQQAVPDLVSNGTAAATALAKGKTAVHRLAPDHLPVVPLRVSSTTSRTRPITSASSSASTSHAPRRASPPSSTENGAASRSTPAKASSSSSGISFGTHGRPIPRKELLGRIGCDKPS